jgi:hypothetical protein
VLTVAAIGIAWLALQTVVRSLSMLPVPAKVAAPRPVPQRPSTTAAPAPMSVAPAALQDSAAAERQAAILEFKCKEAAFQAYFHRSDHCAIEANQATVPCVNEYIRARREFDQRWNEGAR